MTTSIQSNALTVQPARVPFAAESADNLRQDKEGEASTLLALPKEILENIVKFVGSNANGARLAAAKQIVKWSSVCAFANVLTRTPAMLDVINLGKTAFTKWIVDENLAQKLVDGHGNVLSTKRIMCHV